LSRQTEDFRPVRKDVTTVFTCGPSVYQRAHIGNFRTFLCEDILVRYLEYLGHTVQRGMNLTDIEDKAIEEALKRKTSVSELTESNIRDFVAEMKLLRIKIPDFFPRASRAIGKAVTLIERLLDLGIAYWHHGNVYFDPLTYPGFGQLYGLDMTKWPKKRKRFHKDTYPGMRWNLGDFILWHGARTGDSVCWDSTLGKGRPSWNIQDPAMISARFHETLSVYCGGFDNLVRHHDYTRAVLESVRPYPMVRYWMHCYHLHVNGRKMSKSTGNVYYTDTLREHGYDIGDIRFFLIEGHYRHILNYSDENMQSASKKLKGLQKMVKILENKADPKATPDERLARSIRKVFSEHMNNDLDVGAGFDGISHVLSNTRPENVQPGEASAALKALRDIDTVLQVIF
jgi:cysteinyl-tRNA synthetase